MPPSAAAICQNTCLQNLESRPTPSGFHYLPKKSTNTPNKHSDHQNCKDAAGTENNDRIDADLDQTHHTNQWKRHTSQGLMTQAQRPGHWDAWTTIGVR